MVEPKIPDGSKRLSKGDQGARSPYQGPSNDVPVVMNCSNSPSVSSLSASRTRGELLHLSIVRAPAINTAPRMGAKNKIIFQYAGLCALMTFN